MITSKIETITPALAEKYLKSNTSNRTIRWNAVEALKQDILSNRFLTTHQGIAFDKHGVLMDGQHRLLAIVASGRDVQMFVTRGLEDHVNGDVNLYTMDVIDTGKVRSAADQLNLMHGVSNASLTVAALRVIAAVFAPSTTRATMSTSRAVPMLRLYNDEIQTMISIAGSSRVARRKVFVGVMALCSKVDKALAEEFMSNLASGEDIKKGDPVYALREHVVTHGVTARKEQWLTEAAANAFVNTMKGASITLLKAGSAGIDFVRSKQRANAEKVRAIFFAK